MHMHVHMHVHVHMHKHMRACCLSLGARWLHLDTQSSLASSPHETLTCTCDLADPQWPLPPRSRGGCHASSRRPRRASHQIAVAEGHCHGRGEPSGCSAHQATRLVRLCAPGAAVA